jgi:hypothetical protein
LLDRLKAASPEASDWNRLHGIYLPLVARWLGRVPGLGDEAPTWRRKFSSSSFTRFPGFSGNAKAPSARGSGG